MSYEVSVAPASEPITAADIVSGTGLHVTDAGQQTYINLLIKAVRQWIERTYDRAIVTQTILEKLDLWPDGDIINLSVGPVASVSSVKYYDEDDNLQTMSASDYHFSQGRIRSRIVLDEDATWPDLKGKPDAVEITYVAGNGVASVPQNVKDGIRLAIQGVYLTESEDEGEVIESFETSGSFQKLIGSTALNTLFMPEVEIMV